MWFAVIGLVAVHCFDSHRVDRGFCDRMQSRPNKSSSEGEEFFGSHSAANSRGVFIHRPLSLRVTQSGTPMELAAVQLGRKFAPPPAMRRIRKARFFPKDEDLLEVDPQDQAD